MRKMHLIAMAVLLLIGGGGFWYGLKAKEARALRAELRLQCLEIAEKAEQLCWKDFGSARNDASQALGVWIAKDGLKKRRPQKDGHGTRNLC